MTSELINYSNITQEFSSTDLELMSAVEADTNTLNIVTRDSHSGYGRFTIPYTEAVQHAINEYSAGSLVCNARKLLMTRRKLFRAVKALPGGAI